MLNRFLEKPATFAAVLFLLGCESQRPMQRPISIFEERPALRRAAKKILDSEGFPEPSRGEKAAIEREIAYLKNAPRYEPERGGASGTTSRYRISCAILADFGRKAAPFLLRALDDERPIGNLYIAIALEEIEPRLAKGIWAALEEDTRNVPCMKGREFYTVPAGEIAKLRGQIPPETESNK